MPFDVDQSVHKLIPTRAYNAIVNKCFPDKRWHGDDKRPMTVGEFLFVMEKYTDRERC